MSTPKALKMAIVLFPEVQPLDFIGPADLLTPLQIHRLTQSDSIALSPYSLTISYLAETTEPLEMAGGLKVVPDMTYDDAQGKEWDVLLVPGGRGARPWFETNARAREFLNEHVHKATYVLTVCTGSWLLSSTGYLDGKRATSNKAAYKALVEHTSKTNPSIIWVPKARWVVDGNLWTSSGVTAGMDMITAWMDHLLGPAIGLKIRGVLEFTGRNEGEDEWAAFHGLV